MLKEVFNRESPAKKVAKIASKKYIAMAQPRSELMDASWWAVFDTQTPYHGSYRQAYPLSVTANVSSLSARWMARKMNTDRECPERTAYLEKLASGRYAPLVGAITAASLTPTITPTKKFVPTNAVGASVSGFGWDPYAHMDPVPTLEEQVQEAIEKALPSVIQNLEGMVKDLQEQIEELWEELRDGA